MPESAQGFEALARRGQEASRSDRETSPITTTKGDDHAYTNRASVVWQKPTVSPPVIAGRASTAGRGQEPRAAELTVCLLDREPVLADMTGCDRFEVKEPA